MLLLPLAFTELAHPQLSEPLSPAELAFVLAAPEGKGAKKKKQKPHWESDFYARPQVGARIYAHNGTSTQLLTVGGEAGWTYRYVNTPLPRWEGRTRAAVAYVANNSGAGLDVRGGSFMGPHWQHLSVESGADLFWNQWTYDGKQLEPSLGVEVPLIATYRHKKTWGYAGVAASWLDNEARRVDWSQQSVPGVGHEFAYLAGLGTRSSGVDLGVQVEYRITAIGPQYTLMGSASVDGSGLEEILEVLGGSGGDSGSGSKRTR